MNHFAHYQQQQYDLSSQNQQFFDQATHDYYSYSYSYANPQFTAIPPYPYQNFTVQPTQHDEQEPNPPGVTPPPPPPAEQVQNSYYQLAVGAQQGTVDAGVPVVHQPIVQSSHRGIGMINGITPGIGGQTHLFPIPNVSHQPYHVHGHGRGHALHTNAGAPSQNQTVIIHGGSNIQRGPPQPLPMTFAEPHLAFMQNVSSRPYRGRGRGHGRGKDRSLHKHVVPRAQDEKVFIQSGSDIQGGTSQPIPQSVASSFGQIPMPFQVPPQSVPVLPTSKAVCCELCRVECNTVEILKQHISGKKHQKKLKVFEDLQNLNKRAIRRQIAPSPPTELKPEVPSQQPQQTEESGNQQPQQTEESGNQQPQQTEESGHQQPQQETLPSQAIKEESKVAVEEQKVEEVEAAEESVKKASMDRSGGAGRGLKRKMRGGKGGRRTKPCDRSKKVMEPPKPKEVIPLVCELCNVKCESQVVFQSHLVGKKHQSKAKRFQETLGLSATQAPDHQIANASTSIGSQLLSQGFGAYHPGGSAQNVQIIDVQASTLQAVSQPEPLRTNSEAPVIVNTEENSKGTEQLS